MKLFYITGKPPSVETVHSWADVAGDTAKVFMNQDAAITELPALVKAGWTEWRIYSFEIRSIGPWMLEAVEAERLNQAKDDTLQRLEQWREESKRSDWNPHGCYLSPTEQLEAHRLLDW